MSRDQDLLKQLSRTRNLPTLPQVVHLALTHLDVNRNGALDVAAVIAEDPAMTARVLKVANSVLFNPSTDRVVSASEAIARVGFDEVRRIVITIGVIDGFKKAKCNFNYVRYWQHCIATGLLAEIVAGASPVASSEPAFRITEYFPAGLLHDIGVLPMATALKQRYTRLIDQCASKGEALEVMEKKRFGVTHAEIGGSIVETWRIAEAIGQGAKYHDDPEAAPLASRTFVRVIHVADWLANSFDFGLLESICNPARLDPVWCKLALSETDIPQIHESFTSALEDSRLLGLLSSIK